MIYCQRIAKEKFLEDLKNESLTIEDLIERPEIMEMRKTFSPSFFSLWEDGF